MPDRFFDDPLLSEIYDAWHAHEARADYAFYLPIILAERGVLDVGCGTGTLLRDARRLGHRGVLGGIDPAKGMLDRARAHPGIEWVPGLLQDQPWRERFDLIVMTGHAFQAIVSDADIADFLAAVRRALRPGGVFAFETRNPAARDWERWTQRGPVRVLLSDGTPVEIATRIDVGFDGRTVTFTHAFDGPTAGLPAESQSTLRFLNETEINAHLVQAGLRVAQRFGDFNGSPMAPDSLEIVTLAER